MNRVSEPAIVPVASHRIEYERVGTARAGRPELVFLHEGLGSVSMWRDFPDRVAQATGCGAVVASRYGYGRSDPLAAPRTVRYMHDEALTALPEFRRSIAGRLTLLDEMCSRTRELLRRDRPTVTHVRSRRASRQQNRRGGRRRTNRAARVFLNCVERTATTA